MTVYVYSHRPYASALTMYRDRLFHWLNTTHIQCLYLLQNRGINTIKRRDDIESTNKLFVKLNIYKVEGYC